MSIEKALEIHKLLEQKLEIDEFIKVLNENIDENGLLLINGINKIQMSSTFKGDKLISFLKYLNKAYDDYVFDLEKYLDNNYKI